MKNDSSVEIIAEIANAHQGDPVQATELARRAVDAGADSVKFQVYFAEELNTIDHPRFSHFERQQFDTDTWSSILSESKNLGSNLYCDVFGERALEVAESCGVDGFKVHSSDICNVSLIYKLAKLGKPVFLSAGGVTNAELTEACNILWPHVPITLLWGFQTYPTRIMEARLGRIAELHEIFGERARIGYMDHTEGSDVFSTILPTLSLGQSARALEKHITLDRDAKGVDYYSSINVSDLGEFIQCVRLAEEALFGPTESSRISEASYRQEVRKSWVAKVELPVGTNIHASQITMKRAPEKNTSTTDIKQLVGHTTNVPIKKDEVLSRRSVDNQIWVCIVARLASQRLPNKALLDISGRPALSHLIERVKQASSPTKIVLCTTQNREDDTLEELAIAHGIETYRGQENDVLDRMVGSLANHTVDVVVRVTGDDILVDPDYLDYAVGQHLAGDSEYSDLGGLPSGTEVEIFDGLLLRNLWHVCVDRTGTEYLKAYINENQDSIRCNSIPVPQCHQRNWRLTLDTEDDYRLIRQLLQSMKDEGKELTYRMDDLVAFLDDRTELLNLNSTTTQKGLPGWVNTNLDWSKLLK